MKRCIITLVLFALAAGLAGCQQGAPAREPVLEVVGIDGESKSLTLEDLKKLTAYEAWGGSVSSTGRVTPPAMIRGVEL
ncbi:MAG: hypothetical protein GX601_06995, partial [Anaerolineales bacterium]|nr:hypothetical protein [Anaerolineales bacterium]